MKEAFINGIEEVLFLRPAIERASGTLNGDVEAVKRAFKLAAVEGATGEGGDDVLDFGGDDVAAREIGIVEDGAEEAFGQQVLHKHLVHCLTTHGGVERGAAEVEEGGEGAGERAVAGVFFFDALQQALREVGDALAKLVHGLFKGGDIGFGIAEELAQEVGQGVMLCEVYVERNLAVLVEASVL